MLANVPGEIILTVADHLDAASKFRLYQTCSAAHELLASRVWSVMTLDLGKILEMNTLSKRPAKSRLVRNHRLNVVGEQALTRFCGTIDQLAPVLQHVQTLHLFSLQPDELHNELTRLQRQVLLQVVPQMCTKLSQVNVYDVTTHTIHDNLVRQYERMGVSIVFDVDCRLPSELSDMAIYTTKTAPYISRLRLDGAQHAFAAGKLKLPGSIRNLEISVHPGSGWDADSLSTVLQDCINVSRLTLNNLCFEITARTVPSTVSHLELNTLPCQGGVTPGIKPCDLPGVESLAVKSWSGCVETIRALRFSQLRFLMLETRAHHSPALCPDMAAVLSLSHGIHSATVYCSASDNEHAPRTGKYTVRSMDLLLLSLPNKNALRKLYLESEHDSGQIIKAIRSLPSLHSIDLDYIDDNLLRFFTETTPQLDIWFNISRLFTTTGAHNLSAMYSRCLMGNGPRKLVNKSLLLCPQIA